MSPHQPPKQQVRVRAAVPADGHVIARLLEQTDRLHASLRPDLFQIGDPATVRIDSTPNTASLAESAFLVADEGGTVVAVAEIRVASSPAAPMFRPLRKAFVINLVVDGDRRGRGIGSQLLAAIREWALERSLDRIEVNVYADNVRAAEFYAKSGFVVQSQRLELRLPAAT